MDMKLIVRGVSLALVALALTFVTVFSLSFYLDSRSDQQVAGDGGRVTIGGDFDLIDTTGAAVSEDLVRNTPYAIFFGFTFCPEICPTTLAELSGWINQMGPAADEMKFIFVTVDPERDTPDILADYVGAFSNRIIGLTGTSEQVDAAVKTYRVYARRVELDNGDYTMDHSAAILLFDQNGVLTGKINRMDNTDDALRKLKSTAGV